MKHLVISIRDRAMNAYTRPIFVQATGQAIRGFQDEINRSATDNTMYSHPDDFDLYLLGTFDEETGKFESLEVPQQLAIGKQLKQA